MKTTLSRINPAAFVSIFSVLSISCIRPLEPVLGEKVLLFENLGTTMQDYRIPAVLVTSDGAVAAFADRRYSERGADIGAGEIDIELRISPDGGQNWSEPSVVVDGDGSAGFDCAHGDAAVVCDSESGEILLMCASGSVGYPSGGVGIGRYRSRDSGLSFQGGEMDSSNGLPAELESRRKFFSSGRICQSRIVHKGTHYRIYSGLCTGEGSQVVYSDDFGRSWSLLGEAFESGDECKVEELPDGSLLLSCRIVGRPGRMYAVFTYDDSTFSGGKWSRSSESSGITAASCNGELLMLRHKGRDILLQSVACSESREKVSVYWKEVGKNDDYRNPEWYDKWDGCLQVSSDSSCYSTMAALPDGSVAFLWEEGNIWRDWVESYSIYYTRITF